MESTIGEREISRLAEALKQCDSVVIGAGSGLSTAAGLAYSGERFDYCFGDIVAKYQLTDMYTAGFHPFPTPEDYWGYWCRHIWLNRYMPIPKDTYDALLRLVGTKDYFVVTTNVDHCFQRSGFDRNRLYYMQGDYGLLQCSRPCCQMTWDNREQVRAMIETEGFGMESDGTLALPKPGALATSVPSELLPTCPECGAPAAMNLRVDDRFVEDKGWHEARARYGDYLDKRLASGRRVLFLELGVGFNTPGIIKYPFWQMTLRSAGATYACVNRGDVSVPREVRARSICIDSDINMVLESLAA